MNTKLTFYCTHTEYGDFKKSIFETIISDQISTISDANDWLDDSKISEIYNDFDLNLVFDWVIINVQETNENVKEVTLIKTILGQLVFGDEIDSFYIEKGKIQTDIDNINKEIDKLKEKQKPVEKPIHVDYQSVWIDPLGITYKVGFACHNEFAGHWLKVNDKETYHKALSSSKYYYEFLQDKGWTRILGWTNPVSFIIPTKMTPNIKSAIREYCLSQKLDYKNFPEILKS